MPYDNFKSHKKPGFHPLFRIYIFWKTTGGGGQINSPAVLGLKDEDKNDEDEDNKAKGTKVYHKNKT